MCPRGALHGVKDLEGFFCYASGRIGTYLKSSQILRFKKSGNGQKALWNMR